MNQTKIGSRFVVIAGTAYANEKAGSRQPNRRTAPRRILVIRNGELVGSSSGR